MAYFKQTVFGGIAPAIDNRLLAQNYGQKAVDVDLSSGKVGPIRVDSAVHTLGDSNKKSIYKYFFEANAGLDELWLEWDEADVSVVLGPVPGDTEGRVYWTGETYPRISFSSHLQRTTEADGTTALTGPYPRISFKLAVPRPTGSLTLTPTDPNPIPEDETPSEVAYAVTYVTYDGREGPPLISDTCDKYEGTTQIEIEHDRGSNHKLTDANFISKVRLYKSNTGSQNTQFQFLAEINLLQLSQNQWYPVDDTWEYTDDLSQTLGEVLPSATWIGPPDDDDNLYPDGPLQGLMSVSQGVFAGFTGKRFCLSEPFLPHAWPIEYRITIEQDIVGIASTQGGVVALTEGRPYFISGTDPTAMSSVKMDFAQACVNKSSIVELGDYIFYAGPDGLCAVQGARGEVVTQQLLRPSQWEDDYYPQEYKAFAYEGKYVAFWTDGVSGDNGGFMFDPSSQIGRLTLLEPSGEVIGGYEDPEDSSIYLIIGNQVKKYRGGQVSVDGTLYKTKAFETPKPVSMGWVSVDAGFPFTVKVFADGVETANYYLTKDNEGVISQQIVTPSSAAGTFTIPDTIMRLPPVIGSVWEVEVDGRSHIHEICIAQSMEEIRSS